MSAFCVVAPAGAPNVYKLAQAIRPDLPQVVRMLAELLLDQIKAVTHAASEVEKQMKLAAKDNPVSPRLQTMLGVCPMTAAAIGVFAPPAEAFKIAATLRLGSALFHANIPRVGKRVSAAS